MLYHELLKTACDGDFSVEKYLSGLDSITRGFHQEALFNIFYLFYSKRTSSHRPSGGNFSAREALSTDFSMERFMTRNVRSGGDKSDFTMLDYETKTIWVYSSKCKKTYTGCDFDVSDIKDTHNKHEEYNGWKLEVCLVMDDKNKFTDANRKKHKTTLDIYHHRQYDWKDISNMIKVCAIKKDDISTINKVCSLYNQMTIKLRPRFGQYVVSSCTKDLLSKGHKSVINGSICRFGKSICMATDVLNSDSFSLFIFITSQPKTIPSLLSIYNKYDDFKDYVLYDFSDKKQITRFNKLSVVTKKTIVFVSIQTLKSKSKGKLIKNVGKFKPLCLIDEFHTSGETHETTKILKSHNLHKAQTVFYSATYEKIKSYYNVPDSCIVSWGIEDNVWCSKLTPENVAHLKNKYGDIVDDALDMYTIDEIQSHYSILPRLKFIVDRPSHTCVESFKQKSDKSIGYSFDAVKMIEVCGDGSGEYKLVNEGAVVSYFQRMLGGGEYDDSFGVYKRMGGMIEQYKKMCDRDGQGYGKIVPVYMGDGIVQGEQKESPETIIYNCVECIIKCLKSHGKSKMKELNERYTLVNYNTRVNANPEAYFDKLVAENPDKTIILFLGSSLTTGITNKYCDLIKLTHRINSYDRFWQTICRAMNESKERRKKYAYICVDDYQSLGGLLEVVKRMKLSGESEKTAWKRLMKQNIFNICDIDYEGRFVDTSVYDPSGIELFENVYGMIRNTTPYNDNASRYIQYINFGDIENLSSYLVKLTTRDKQLSSKLQKSVERLDELKEMGIEKGIKVEKIKKEIEEGKEEIANNNTYSFQEMLRVLISTYVMLTTEVNGFDITKIVDYLKEKKLWDVVVQRCCNSFGLSVSSSIDTIMKLNSILMDPKNIDIVNECLETLKEQLRGFRGTLEECYKMCQDVIVTTHIERKQNAEVLTPLPLVKEMLEKIPRVTWTTKRNGRLPRIFDPCVGKGAFVVVIYDMLFEMDEMKRMFPQDKERRRVILQEMLFFADINPFNIYITKMIIDPSNEFEWENVYEGNTLEMDIKEKWGFPSFDIIVSNPPYEDTSSEKRKALNHNLWSEFLNWSYDRINEHGLLLFITPTSWMSPTSKNKDIFYKNHILYLNVNECKKYFNVGSTFSYYVIRKTDIIGDTEVVCNYKKIYKSVCNLNGMEYLPNFTTKETINIIKKFMNNELPKVSFHTSCELHNTTHKNKLNDNKKDDYIYPVRHTTKRNIRYSNIKHTKQDKKKILLNLSGNLNPIYDDGTMGFTQAQMYLLTDKKEYVIILNSKLYKFVFAICKWSGFNIEKIYHNIPFITENKSDNELYNTFNLTKEEIEMIES